MKEWSFLLTGHRKPNANQSVVFGFLSLTGRLLFCPYSTPNYGDVHFLDIVNVGDQGVDDGVSVKLHCHSGFLQIVMLLCVTLYHYYTGYPLYCRAYSKEFPMIFQ
jgi:hypothetical protein